MSSLAKIVKVVAILMMLLGLVAIGVGIFMFVAGPGIEVDGQVAGDAAHAGGIIMVVFGVFYLVSGVIGARGANNAAKLTPFIVLCFIIAVLNIAEVVLGLQGGDQSTLIYNVVYVVVALIGAIAAISAKKDVKNRLL